MAVCTATDLPLAWNARAARDNESIHAVPLIDKAKARGFAVETCAMHKGYDLTTGYDGCEARDVRPIIPLRQTPGVKFGQNKPPLYRRRASVEREFGRLKHGWGLAPLRARGLDRVKLHADLTILAKLSCALARARGIALVG